MLPPEKQDEARPSLQGGAPDKEFIRDAFDAITPCYDGLNQILSFGMADWWRKKACEIVLEGDIDVFQIPLSPPLPKGERGGFPARVEQGVSRYKTILDLGCGTGKFLEAFLKKKSWESATGVDFSVEMLKKARATVSGNVMWLREDFDVLPFLEASFDLVISAFTLRSVQKLPEFLSAVLRILTPGGKAAFLDLTRPRNFAARLLFFPYLKFILPLLGWLISGNRKAYGFLSESVRHFQAPEETVRLMQAAGYRDLTTKSFAFGAATLIIGTK